MVSEKPRVHRLGALMVASVSLAVYVRTMYPGLVPFGDSPKFQFVGRIWGTPHNPGYPLYIVVSHLFGLLPIATLAYRINLMSAVFGAVAAGVMTLLVARLTGRVWAGIAAGFGLAFGRVFWSQAIVAEVYTLAAALLLGTTYWAVRWADTRRARDLLAAVVLASLAVGNHLTIVMFAPGLIVLVLLTDWRRALRPRLLSAMAALVAAGLSQYLLLIYLTSRRPPYLESSAGSLSELVPIVAGAQFRDRFGHFGWQELLTSRSAQLFRILRDETGLWGIAAAAIGLIWLARTRPAVAAGFTVAAIGVWTFVLGYDIADPQVFLIPVVVVLWTLAGVAIALVIGAAARAGRTAGVGAGVVAASLAAVTAYTSNVRANDHHKRTYETAFMNAVFLTLPNRALLVPGTFSEQLMLQYKLYGERAGADRAIELHGIDAGALKRAFAQGRPVYAFTEARDQLARSGFLFETVPLGAIAPDPVLFRLSGVRECRDIANSGWIDVSPVTAAGRLAVRVDNYRPFDAHLWLVLTRDTAAATMMTSSAGPGRPAVTTQVFDRSSAEGLRQTLAAAGFSAAIPRAPFVEIVHVQVNDNGEFQLLTLDLAGAPVSGFARGTADLNNPRRLTVCAGGST